MLLYTHYIKSGDVPLIRRKSDEKKQQGYGFWVAMTVLSLAACGEVPGVQEASKDAEIRTEEDGGQTGGEVEAGRDADENLSTEENPGTEEKPGAEENSSTEEIRMV